MYVSASLIQVFRGTSLGKILSIGIALYLFNISIDSVDPIDLQGKENLWINDIESFAELIVEDFANYEDFFQEFDDQESDSTLQKTSLSFIGIIAPLFSFSTGSQRVSQSLASMYVPVVYDIFLTISSPPPEFV